jgi:hypothetical protein
VGSFTLKHLYYFGEIRRYPLNRKFVGARIGLNTVTEKKILPLLGIEHRSSIPQPVTLMT